MSVVYHRHSGRVGHVTTSIRTNIGHFNSALSFCNVKVMTDLDYTSCSKRITVFISHFYGLKADRHLAITKDFLLDKYILGLINSEE